MNEEKFLKLLEEEGTDVCADYGENYGCAWGYSYELIERVLDKMEEENENSK